MLSKIIVTRKRLYDENEEAATQPDGCGVMLAAIPGQGSRPQNTNARWWIEFFSGKVRFNGLEWSPRNGISPELNHRISDMYVDGWRCWSLWDNESQDNFGFDSHKPLKMNDVYTLLERYFDWVDGKWWEELVSVSYWIHSVEVAIKNEIIPSDISLDGYGALAHTMISAVKSDALDLARNIIKDAKEIYDEQSIDKN